MVLCKITGWSSILMWRCGAGVVGGTKTTLITSTLTTSSEAIKCRYNMSLSCGGHFDKDCPALADYRFYLAFENALCSEYITEKLWWNAFSKVERDLNIFLPNLTYHQGVVPIVLGGLGEEDYRKLAHPNSYLHVDQFSGPKQLIAQVNSTSDILL